MKNRVVRLTESDLENLVKRIIKENEGPQQVQLFISKIKEHFFERYPKYLENLNTTQERVSALVQIANIMGVDPNEIQRAKSVAQRQAQKQSQEPQSQEGL